MNAQQLRNSILQQAIQGKLVPQDPNDEPASVLLQRIRKEKECLVKEGKLKKKDLESKPIEEDEIPFEIPESWEWVRLKDFIQFINGDRGKNYPSKDKLSESGEIPFISAINIKGTSISNEKLLFLSQPQYDALSQGKLKKNDIVLCIRGSLGKAALYPFEQGAIASSLVILRNIGETSLQYILRFLTTPSFYSQINTYDNGTAQPNLSADNVANFIIPLPPLSEQRRIVAKIEELMPLVERYGKAQQALDQLNESLPARLRQSILQEAIQGRLVPQDPKEEPASELLKRIRKEKEQLVKEGKLKKKELESKPIEEDEIPFEVPEGWEWCHFGEIVNMQMGKTPPRGEAIYWGKGIDSWVSISDMKDYGHITKTKEKVSKYAAENAFRKKSPVGTLIMSFKLTVGRTSILDIPAYHNEAIISIFPYCDLNNSFRDYLFYLLPLLANLGDSKDAIKGKTLNSNSLYNLLIPLPPLSEQKRIVAKVEELFGVMG